MPGSASKLLARGPEAVARPSAEQWSIAAVHEAAHARAYLYFGLRFHHVAIFPSDDGSSVIGTVRAPNAADPNYGKVDCSALRRACICVAGSIAAARYTGTDLRELLGDNSAAVDVSMATTALQADPAAPAFAAAVKATERLVSFEWPRIMAIAAALVRGRTLDYFDALQLVGQ